MKIDIITIARNSEATIGQTLDSVAEQTHPDVEQIVVDGASTDRTLEIVAARGTRVGKLVSERDGGIYEAMNKGLALTSGDVVGFLNSDDAFADRDVLRDVAATFDSAATPDVVYGDLVYVAEGDGTTVVRRWASGTFTRSRLRFGWMPPHPSFFVRRRLLDTVGGFDASMRIAADYDFMVRCLIHPGVRVQYLARVLVKMRLGGVSNASLQSMLKKSAEDLTVMRRYRIGSWFTLAMKNLRKLPQFVVPARRLGRPATRTGPTS